MTIDSDLSTTNPSPPPENPDCPRSKWPCVRIRSSTSPYAPWKVPGTEVTTRELRNINGPKELYNILQDKHKIIQQHNVLILLIILETVTCQNLTNLRSWLLRCPGVHTSAPGHRNEKPRFESPENRPTHVNTQKLQSTLAVTCSHEYSGHVWFMVDVWFIFVSFKIPQLVSEFPCLA